MENWKLSELKAHQQFTLGRIDALRWSINEVLKTGEPDQQLMEDIQERIKKLIVSEKECSKYIQKILDARAEEKQRLEALKADNHKKFGGR